MAQFIFVGSPVPEIVFTDSAANSAAQSSYNFTSRSLGDAAADRLIVVGVTGRRSNFRNIDSVSIAGGAATENIQFAGGFGQRFQTGIFQRLVPTGTSGTISVTFDGAMDNCLIGVWRLTRYKNATPTDTDTAFDDTAPINPSLSLNVLAGGAVIALAALFRDSSYALTNVDEDFQETDAGDNTDLIGAHRAGLDANGSYAVGSSGTVDTSATLVGASWR